MTSPFIFDCSHLLRSSAVTETKTTTGNSPVRIGPEMIAIAQDTPVEVSATFTPLGEAIMVDATVTAQLTGQCARCLNDLTPSYECVLNEVYTTDEAITHVGAALDEDEDDGDDQRPIVKEQIDLTQALIDTLVLQLPFSPTCADFGGACDHGDNAAAEPDGVSGEEAERIDPRWAGLEKFL